MIGNGDLIGLYEENGKIMAQDIWAEHHEAERDVAAEISSIEENWLNEEIELSQIDAVLDTEICGNYDVKRDFMHNDTEGSVGNGSVNVHFELMESLQEEPFETKVKITKVDTL